MDLQYEMWRARAEALAMSKRFNFDDAADLLAAVVRSGRDFGLREAANQALSSVRAGARPGASIAHRQAAQSRFDAFRDELRGSAGSTFGRRTTTPAPSRLPETELIDRSNRQLLGLPMAGSLMGAEIRAAFRRIALMAHPDMGGDIDAFVKITAARDFLLARA